MVYLGQVMSVVSNVTAPAHTLDTPGWAPRVKKFIGQTDLWMGGGGGSGATQLNVQEKIWSPFRLVNSNFWSVRKQMETKRKEKRKGKRITTRQF